MTGIDDGNQYLAQVKTFQRSKVIPISYNIMRVEDAFIQIN